MERLLFEEFLQEGWLNLPFYLKVGKTISTTTLGGDNTHLFKLSPVSLLVPHMFLLHCQPFSLTAPKAHLHRR